MILNRCREARRSVSLAAWRTLARALHLEESFDAGIFPRGSSQFRHFRRLVACGLLVEAGYGTDIDGMRNEEVLVFRLTDIGRTLIRAIEAEADARLGAMSAMPRPNCPLQTGLRPCECDLPRCPECNYTTHDAAFEMDHDSCPGCIPKMIASAADVAFDLPLEEMALLDFVAWDRYAGRPESFSLFGWIERPGDAYRDFVIFKVTQEGIQFSTSSAEWSAEISRRMNGNTSTHQSCRRVEEHPSAAVLPNVVRLAGKRS